MPDVVIRRFRPLHLKLEDVGPFRGAFELPLTGLGEEPANFFLLISPNGYGKTTILEVIHDLMGGLDAPASMIVPRPPVVPRRNLHPDLLSGGRAQLDILLDLESGEKSLRVVLSLFAGGETPPLIITPSRLEKVGAERWIPLPLLFGDSYAYPLGVDEDRENEIVPPVLRAIRAGGDSARRFLPNGESLFLPTALYFTADRRIVQPSATERSIRQPLLAYAPAHKFTTDGASSETSLDSLLVWYDYLGGGLVEGTCALVNKLLFAGEPKRLIGVDRHALAAVIEVEREDGTKHRHGIDRLSHGERNLLHLLVRTAYHKTGSTILLIDELETHLHPKWQQRLMAILKGWIRDWPDLTVIATSHNPDMIETFEFERKEESIVKGGYLIEATDL